MVAAEVPLQRKREAPITGTYPDVSLKGARERRDEARKLVANKIDPSAHRKAQKTATIERAENSFEMVTREWFTKHKINWAPAHASRIIRRFERDIFGWLGDSPVADITAPQLLEVIQRIEARGALETAHRTLGNCGQVFRYAVATGRAERDPSSDLRDGTSPIKNRGHFAAVTEPQQVAGVLRALDGYQGTLPVQCALKLAPLVFVRPGELRRNSGAISI
ncbi:Integrase [hydrothermal vent metagenome]|uniref:Integrase n=1 Tax=hydrothermal vent metagenome TaxID=652676 RepID=A0A3B1AZX8_9ZZZZ